jgi:hypothetical protein
MAIQTFDKEFVARTQLDRAIALFAEPGEYLSAITLAGAAEEILGKLVTESGRDNSLTSLTQAAAAVHEHLFQEVVEPSVFLHAANRARNALKHLDTSAGRNIVIDPQQEASDIINRAIDNYWILTSSLTPPMADFGRSHDGA